jgi:hypothetical protein
MIIPNWYPKLIDENMLAMLNVNLAPRATCASTCTARHTGLLWLCKGPGLAVGWWGARSRVADALLSPLHVARIGHGVREAGEDQHELARLWLLALVACEGGGKGCHAQGQVAAAAQARLSVRAASGCEGMARVVRRLSHLRMAAEGSVRVRQSSPPRAGRPPPWPAPAGPEASCCHVSCID